MSNKIEYKSNNNIVYSCKYHIIWSPKVGGTPLEIVKQYVENQQTSERPKEKQKWKKFLKDVNKNI